MLVWREWTVTGVVAPDAAGSLEVVIVGVEDRELDGRYAVVCEVGVKRRATLPLFSAEHKGSDIGTRLFNSNGELCSNSNGGVPRSRSLVKVQMVGWSWSWAGITAPRLWLARTGMSLTLKQGQRLILLTIRLCRHDGVDYGSAIWKDKAATKAFSGLPVGICFAR